MVGDGRCASATLARKKYLPVFFLFGLNKQEKVLIEETIWKLLMLESEDK